MGRTILRADASVDKTPLIVSWSGDSLMENPSKKVTVKVQHTNAIAMEYLYGSETDVINTFDDGWTIEEIIETPGMATTLDEERLQEVRSSQGCLFTIAVNEDQIFLYRITSASGEVVIGQKSAFLLRPYIYYGDTEWFKFNIWDYTATPDLQNKSKENKFILFTAAWDGNSEKAVQTVLEVSAIYGNRVHFCGMDIDENPEVFEAIANITQKGIPLMVMITADGQLSYLSGNQSKEAICDMIKQGLNA